MLITSTSEEELWDFKEKGIKRNEFCFRMSKAEDINNNNQKASNLKYKYGSLCAEDDSLIAKCEVGEMLQCNRCGDSKNCVLKET